MTSEYPEKEYSMDVWLSGGITQRQTSMRQSNSTNRVDLSALYMLQCDIPFVTSPACQILVHAFEVQARAIKRHRLLPPIGESNAKTERQSKIEEELRTNHRVRKCLYQMVGIIT